MKRMKQLSLAVLLSWGLSIVGCTNPDADSSSQANANNSTPVDVYVAGIKYAADLSPLNSQAVYWKNGVRTELTDGSTWASATRIFVVNNDVYVLGRQNTAAGDQEARLWKNGVAQNFLPDLSLYVIDIEITATDIHVITQNSSGNNVYWKNGVEQVFIPNDAPVSFSAIDVSGNDVYICGYNQNGGIAYWKNGISHPLTGISTSINSENPNFKDIKVAGNDVYVIGQYPDTHPDNSPGEPLVGVCWKNGQPTVLGYYRYVERVSVVGSDVYITGSYDNKAAYYKNGQLVNLATNSASLASITYGAFTKNGNVYISGSTFNPNQACYWINGILTSMDDGIAYDIVAVQH